MRAKRIDSNQAEIVSKLRACMLSVIDLSALGRGVPDLLVASAKDIWLVEIKTENGALNQRQLEWHQKWMGKPVIIGKSFEEIYKEIKKPTAFNSRL